MSISLTTDAPRRRQRWYERHRRSIVTTVAALLLIALVVRFLQPPEPSRTFSDPSQPVDVRVGDVFALTVTANSDNARGWNSAERGGGIGFDDPYVKPVSATCDSQREVCLFVYQALAPGSRTISYSWAGTNSNIRPKPDSYSYRVRITQ